jgi:hypothetical protein
MREPASAYASRGQGCIAELEQSQNPDGGWGFYSRRSSRIEPTAWALIARRASASSGAKDSGLERGFQFLAQAQLQDGSWPSARGQHEGCWVTSLACWALLDESQYAESVSRGLRWLDQDRPGDSRFWWRMGRKILHRPRANEQSADLFGWSWTPGTASWVEPTCYALIVLGSSGARSLPTRQKVAEAMLYDRMCPGGGWNCGNPRVYGVAGQPQVGPTVWALIALRQHLRRAENQLSLGWLESQLDEMRSAESLALAEVALEVYDRPHKELAERISALPGPETPASTTQAIAWTLLALQGNSLWLPKCREV